MRGTPRCEIRFVVQFGIIPAYAGNTSRRSARTADERDHPRVCGEHGRIRSPIRMSAGSSPRMRGTHLTNPDLTPNRGIIPAYAGNTTARLQNIEILGDHPRVCGEHARRAFASLSGMGSSPRMRGTHYRSIAVRAPIGIIPAYAGNTVLDWESQDNPRDHPRVCGEHTLSGIAERTGLGSSPRMRGTLAVCNDSSAANRDHPRVCGEHMRKINDNVIIPGSSPRMRGTLLRYGVVYRYDGIIPAYAGNTRCASSGVRLSRDHPRVCGEHVFGVL